MADENLEPLEAEAALAATGMRKPMRQAIPVRIVENLQLAAVTPEAIRRTLQGRATRVGAIIGVEWYLIDHDASAALYEAACPYPFCEGSGTLLASTRIDKHGKAELPFSDPGALCCEVCDLEIEARYDREAAQLANARKRMGAMAEG